MTITTLYHQHITLLRPNNEPFQSLDQLAPFFFAFVLPLTILKPPCLCGGCGRVRCEDSDILVRCRMTTYIYKREMAINTATLSARLHLPSRRTIRKTKAKVPHSSLIYRSGERRLPQVPSSVANVYSTTSNIMYTTESPINQTKRPYSDNPFSWSFRHRRRRRRQGRVRIQRRPRKIVVVGTMNCGKSSLISAYCHDQFSDIYQPTILRCLPSDARVQGHKIDIIVVDTPGRIDYLPIRRCAYQKLILS